MRTEYACNLGKHPRRVDNGQSEIVSARDLFDRKTLPVQAVRRESERFSAGYMPNRRLRQVADHRAGRRVLSSAAAIKEGVTDKIAAHHQRVKDAVDRCEHMLFWHQGWMHMDFYQAVGGSPDGCNEFDPVPEPIRKPDIRRIHGLDPGDMSASSAALPTCARCSSIATRPNPTAPCPGGSGARRPAAGPWATCSATWSTS